MSGKYVYFFGDGTAEGRGDMKNLLGGKGANLAEMTSIGLPVPAGFTLTTDVCTEFYDNDRNYPQGLEAEVDQHLARVETMMGKTFGEGITRLGAKPIDTTKFQPTVAYQGALGQAGQQAAATARP